MKNTSTTEKILHQLCICMNLQRRRGHHHKGQHHGQGGVLRILAQNEGINQRDLAEQLGIQPPSLSEVIGKLDNQGLIKRSEHPQDKRMSIIHITDKGLEAIAEKQKMRAEMNAQLMQDFSSEEQNTLLQLLEKFTQSLEAQTSCKHGDSEEHHGHGACCRERGEHGEHHGRGHHGKGHGGCCGHEAEDHGHHGHGDGCCGRKGGHRKHGDHSAQQTED